VASICRCHGLVAVLSRETLVAALRAILAKTRSLRLLSRLAPGSQGEPAIMGSRAPSIRRAVERFRPPSGEAGFKSDPKEISPDGEAPSGLGLPKLSSSWRV
jgi:hypothetical protein